jgi:serine/threonine-protein kinase
MPTPPDETFDLATTPLLAVLGRMSLGTETGFVLIEGKPPADTMYARREVYLKTGTLHHIATSDVSELLGQSLVRRGLISPPELDMALAVLSKFDGRLGDTLVALGLIDAMELFRAIEEQGKERLARVFGWSEGRATFYRGVLPTRVEFPLELELADLMLAGLEVAQPSDAPVMMFENHLEKKLRRGRREQSPKKRAALPRSVVLFLDALGGGMSLRQVMMRLGTTGAIGAADALRAMQVAIALGLVEESS